MLNLHLMQEDTSVLREFDLACTTDQPTKKNVKIAPKSRYWREKECFMISGLSKKFLHLERSFGTQIGLEDLLEAFSGVNVDTESGGLADNVGFFVQKLE